MISVGSTAKIDSKDKLALRPNILLCDTPNSSSTWLGFWEVRSLGFEAFKLAVILMVLVSD